MKSFITTLLFVSGVSSMGLAATAQSKTIDEKEKLEQLQKQEQAEKAVVSDNVEALLKKVEDTYGFDVDCGVSVNQCYVGLKSLLKALESSAPAVEREKLHDVEILISERGDWKIAKFGEPSVRIPYVTKSEHMARFINGQLELYILKTPEEIASKSAELAKEIREKYLFNVEKAPRLRNEYYALGLTTLKYVLSNFYNDPNSPTEDEKAQVGYDTIVMSDDYDTIYENKGELRINLDYETGPGDMGMQLISQIRPTSGESNSSFAPSFYTRENINEFRDNRALIKSDTEQIAKLANGLKVICLLDRGEDDSLTVRNCAHAVSNVLKGLAANTNLLSRITAKKLAIIDTAFDYHKVVADGIHVIGDDLTPDDVIEALVRN